MHTAVVLSLELRLVRLRDDTNAGMVTSTIRTNLRNKTIVLILDGNSEIRAHVRSNDIWRLKLNLIRSRVTNPISFSPKRLFFYAFATCSELPSNTRTMNKPCSAMPVFVLLISFWNCNFAILLNFLPSRAARHPAVQKTICLKIPFNMRNIHGESVLSPSVLYPEYFCPLVTCHKAFLLVVSCQQNWRN